MGAFKLQSSWAQALKDELEAPYLKTLVDFLDAESAAGKEIFPERSNWFRALDLTPPEAVRVVLLGQDPYHGPGQAQGLCFSVQPEVRIPPSLKNIFKEIESDLGLPRPAHGDLEYWAKQGVLLLNSVLTVEMGKAASHQKKGWEKFTDAIIHYLSERAEPIVFILWGAYARKKASFIRSIEEGGHHLILTAPHPSPLSAYSGFLGCRHFSKTNDFLAKSALSPINWELPTA